ncbi:hypothetical protein LSG25_08200 [Paralcaligenes sp. KSB-10]|uniref:hypothetical protein n=1 Tax=Paralcaligenes sp. KSB-10 TaxID=2901142 RepID=UPI001E5A1A9C|nr:hypothetical protein [Paralcaligenes sp. KSB-10]UHL65837.1 hypothetical protein LSG25_08200 [Paralcaligenes sp. KSB-10]
MVSEKSPPCGKPTDIVRSGQTLRHPSRGPPTDAQDPGKMLHSVNLITVTLAATRGDTPQKPAACARKESRKTNHPAISMGFQTGSEAPSALLVSRKYKFRFISSARATHRSSPCFSFKTE